MAHKALLSLDIRSVDENRRMLRGIANSGQRDRTGEIVDVMSARFAATVPLLVAHDHRMPVGTVRFGTPTAAGLPFEATMPTVDEPGPLKDRVDTAWGEVRHRLVNKVSIGFGDGKFASGVWSNAEIFELSLVAVPADSRADILEVSGAKALRAERGPVRLGPTGSSKPRTRVIVLDAMKRVVDHYAREYYKQQSGAELPLFRTEKARDLWREKKRAEARQRGIIWLDPFDVSEGARRLGRLRPKKPVRVVKLGG